MSENNEDLTISSETDDDLVKRLRAELKAKTDSERAALERASAVEKSSTFKELGIDPSSGVGKLFFESYKGEATAEAIAAEAEKYAIPVGGQPAAPEAEAASVPSISEQAAHAAMNRAAAGAGSTPVQTDLNKVAWEAHDTTFKATGSQEAASAAHFGAKLAAAVAEKRGG